jgi:hypothetical protein
MLGHFPCSLDEKFVDRDQSRRIKGEAQSIMLAAQDQALSKNYFETILMGETERKFRLYKEYEETIDHLISGCPIFAKNE